MRESTKKFSSRLDLVSDLAELRVLLSEQDTMSWSAREIGWILRAANRVGIGTDARVAFCGTHTFEPLPAYLTAHGLGLGLGIVTHIAPYGQYMQQLLTDDSELVRFEPELLLLSCAMRQIEPRLHYDFAALHPSELVSVRERVLDHLTQAADAAVAHTPAVVLVANFPRPQYPSLGVADSKQPTSEIEFYFELNLELLRRFRSSSRVHVFDLDRLIGGVRNSRAERMFFIAKTVWGESDCNSIAQELTRYVVAATGRTRKCLIVDLDNTLWSGAVGEEGAAGIGVGAGSALAEAFESHQHAVRALRHRGIMLAVCSKNNRSDVDEAFSKRTDMPLKWEDFVAAEVSWNDKASGIVQLASELNVGQDSLVFIDDNPAERAIVRGELPAVTVPELPRDPADYATFLRQQVFFEKLRISQDDLVRLRDYGAKRSRERLRADVRDLDRYLAGLETRIQVRPADRADLSRVHELFNKTNQFNLTTHRYSIADVEGFIGDPRSRLCVVSASDRFGAMGTVGVYLMRHQGGEVLLDSLLLSCRVLGRGIGTATMNCVKLEVKEVFGCERLIAEFVPTAKNTAVNGFLTRQGLEFVVRHGDGTELYRTEGDAGLKPLPCSHVAVNHELVRSGVKK